MTGFTFETTPRIVCEDGAAGRIGETVRARGVTRALVVSDPGLVKAGVIEPALKGLSKANIYAALYPEVAADPPQAMIEAALAHAREEKIDGVIGIGGGSSMDTAKLIALLARTPQPLEDAFGVNVAKGPRLPLILAPTTAGTGSEVTPISIVTTPDDQKKGVVSPLLYPDVALLDATLTLALPARVTAMTGVDAMVHAIEAYTSRLRKNPLSDGLAVTALKLLHANIRRAVADGADIDARRAMLQGALAAGMAFANAPVGAVHALAYPLGGVFHAPHGLSNALVLAPVLEYNAPVANEAYAELARVVGAGDTADAFIADMRRLVSDMPMERTLSQIGVERQHIERLARDAMQVERLLVNNPREMTYEAARDIYASIL